MSNLQNPIRVYEIDLTLVGELDDYANAYFTRSWYGIGEFAIQTNYNTVHATDLQKGRIVMFGKDAYRAGIITKIEKKLDENGKGGQILTASGFEIKYIFRDRIVLPAAGQPLYSLSDKAETVMKTLVTDQCGADADADRQFPNLTVATDLATGSDYVLNLRYNTTVADELQKIAMATNTGYFVYINETTKKFVFDCSQGLSRIATQSVNGRAIFSEKYDTIKSAKFTVSDNQYRNYAYVAGQGVGVDRTVREVFSTTTEPTGFDRKEIFVDAREVSTNADLDAKGGQKLGDYAIQSTIDGIPLTYSTLVYRTDYDLGDTVTIDVYGSPYDARITAVKESWSPLTYSIDLTFDKEAASLPTQVNRAVESIRSTLSIAEGKPSTSALAYTNAARDSNGDLSARAFKSSATTGTAPLEVASTTEVANLRAATATTVPDYGIGVYGVPTTYDLNTLKINGKYSFKSDSTHTPVAAAGSIDVSTYNSTYIMQKVQLASAAAGSREFIRNSGDGGSTWITGTGSTADGWWPVWNAYNDGSGSGLDADLHDGLHVKKLTGTTASGEGGYVQIAHGLTDSKIVAVTALVEHATSQYITSGYTYSAGFYFSIFTGGGDIYIGNDATNSENILSKPIKILVWYEP